jgi:hypothetical protein
MIFKTGQISNGVKKILTFAIITVAVIGLGSVVAVKVQAEGGSGNGFYSVIIQKLVDRFGLNADEVQQVFDEAQDEMRQQMQARFGEGAGDRMEKFTPPECTQLTDEQEQAISAKREELKEQYGDLKGLSREEMQTKMQEMKTEMETWAESQGIDLKCIGFMGGWFGPGSRGPHNGFGWGPAQGFFRSGQE